MTSTQELLTDLRSGRPIEIKVFNLGENLGMDFAYYGHYHALQDLFPNVKIDLYRSNVDETNCIGFEAYRGKANLPVRHMEMAIVKQRYGGHSGPDWCQKLNAREYDIFSDEFRSVEGYDYVWGIGYGSAPVWQQQYPEGTKFLNSNTVAAALEQHMKENGLFKDRPVLDLGINQSRLIPWDRTAMEHAVLDKPDYPFTFTPEFQSKFNPQFQDYLRVSLRWPDNVRWYWGIDRQFEALFQILQGIRQEGKPVKVIYTLKDGEVGKNFNRGQTVDYLKRVQDACDDCIFIYSWPDFIYHARLSEEEEVFKMQMAGIKNIQRVSIWDDLLLTSKAKVYFSDPGGFAEVICMLRQPETTFLMPTSFQHLCTYITMNQDRQPVHLKINKLCVDQGYKCDAVLSAPDDPEGYRTLHWNMAYLEDYRVIGNNNHGDDWKYFELAQNDVFKDWYNATSPALVNAIVEEYIK